LKGEIMIDIKKANEYSQKPLNHYGTIFGFIWNMTILSFIWNITNLSLGLLIMLTIIIFILGIIIGVIINCWNMLMYFYYKEGSLLKAFILIFTP